MTGPSTYSKKNPGQKCPGSPDFILATAPLLYHGRKSTRTTGRSSGSRISLLAAPSHPERTVTFLRLSSPVTAAGPLPILTGFPLSSCNRNRWYSVFLTI